MFFPDESVTLNKTDFLDENLETQATEPKPHKWNFDQAKKFLDSNDNIEQ